MSDDNTLRNRDDAGDDWLDRLLVADAAATREAYIADDGFTAKVMAVVPAPVSLPAWRKPAVAALWAVAGVGIAMAAPGAALEVAREAYRLLATVPISLSGIAGAAVAMMALTGAAAAYSLRSTD